VTERVYSDQKVALLTQHGKEKVLAPVLEPALGCKLALVTGYDTDQLGTFTRDIPRLGTQIDAARRKARIGMDISGLPLGLASEGSLGADPFVGMFPWNLELLLFIDDIRGIEVTGVAQGNAQSAHLLTGSWVEAESFALQAGFPQQFLVLRPEAMDDPRIRKGITSASELRAAFAWALDQAANGQVFLETDARAYANPTRMENISRAAEDLVKRLGSPCPACSAPGFWAVEHIPGLCCADCDAPTREIYAEVYGCVKCEHRETRERTDRQFAEPGHCDYCNP
jgi:hypothetical protein